MRESESRQGPGDINFELTLFFSLFFCFAFVFVFLFCYILLVKANHKASSNTKSRARDSTSWWEVQQCDIATSMGTGSDGGLRPFCKHSPTNTKYKHNAILPILVISMYFSKPLNSNWVLIFQFSNFLDIPSLNF